MIKVIKVKSYKEEQQQEEIRRSQQLDQGLKCEGDIKTYTSMEEYHKAKQIALIQELLYEAEQRQDQYKIKELEKELKELQKEHIKQDRKTILFNIKANIKAFIRSFRSNKDNN